MALSRGEDRPTAKLTERQVREIIVSEDKCCVLAARYGCSIPNISYIKRGLRWKHVFADMTNEILSAKVV